MWPTFTTHISPFLSLSLSLPRSHLKTVCWEQTRGHERETENKKSSSARTCSITLCDLVPNVWAVDTSVWISVCKCSLFQRQAVGNGNEEKALKGVVWGGLAALTRSLKQLSGLLFRVCKFLFVRGSVGGFSVRECGWLLHVLARKERVIWLCLSKQTR